VLATATYGLAWYRSLNDFINASCAPDLSKCTAYDAPALVFQSPSATTAPGCVSNKTCVTVASQCNSTITTLYDGSSARKSGFNIRWNAFFKTNSGNLFDLIAPVTDNGGVDITLLAGGPGYLYGNGLIQPGTYIPLSDFYYNAKINTDTGNIYSYIGQINFGFLSLQLKHCVPATWLIGTFEIAFFAESSPSAVIPLDYNNGYVLYQELRKAFAYSYDGVSQFGWNAQDIISVLKDIYPNRAWAVFDDNQQMLYLYNLTMDYVPDWLVEKLAPAAVKVLKPPPDSGVAKAWMDELSRRNAYNTPPSVRV
jgi:hypothetical protein